MKTLVDFACGVTAGMLALISLGLLGVVLFLLSKLGPVGAFCGFVMLLGGVIGVVSGRNE